MAEHILIALVLIAATPLLVCTVLYLLHTLVDAIGYPAAIRSYERAGQPAHAIECFDDARKRDSRKRLASAFAPVIVPIALMFTPRDADKLPGWAWRWDNNISINGDGGGILYDGKWIDERDVTDWEAVQGAPYAKYTDPDYGGDAYYAKGHHPRSFYARWVWLGFRNRCAAWALQMGEPLQREVMTVAAEPKEPRASPAQEGFYLLRAGDLWQWREFVKLGPLVICRHLGFKVDNAAFDMTPALPTAISFSLKRWDGA